MATPSEESEKAKKQLKEVSDIVGALDEGFRELTSRLTDVVDEIKEGSSELTSFNNVTKDINRSLRSISKANEDLIKNQIKLNQGKLTSKQVEEQINKAIATRQVLTGRLDSLQKKLNSGISVSIAEYDEVMRLQEAIAEISGEVVDNFEKQKDEAQKLEKILGITGKTLKGISKIPIIGDLVDTEEALQAATIAAQNGAGKIGAMGAAIGSLGKSLLSSLTDPLVVIGLLVKGFQKLVELGFAADKQIVDLSKSMGSSREQAAALRQRFTEIQDGSIKIGGSLNDNLKTTKNLVAAQLELADAFGTGLGFTDRQLADQVLLTKEIGLSIDEATSLQQLAMANGKTADDVVDSTIKQTAALARQTGIQLNNKKILGEVAKVSGQIRLQYQNNPDLIAKAVVQTQKLGISLGQAAKMSSYLLNFEESISDQISAELLTGKQLNLEKARLLALNGDIAGASAEILKQVGSATEFGEMNVIQQEALAKAAGMTADELANSLVQQESLNRLGDAAKKDIAERVKMLKLQGREIEANELMASIGNETKAKEALIAIDSQTNFNNLIEKLQGILGNMAAGPMADILNKISEWTSKTENIQGLMDAVSGTAKVIASITKFLIDNFKAILVIVSAIAAYMITSAIAAAIINPIGAAVGVGIAAAALAGGAVALSDGEVSSDGLVVGKYNKGQIQPIAQGLPEDNVIFTTNKPTSVNNSNTNNSDLAREMREIKAILADTLNVDKQIAANNMARQAASIVMDSTRLGTAVNMGTYSVQ
jgi:hypothetical protein